MKIISLNTWGGRVKEPFNKFIKKHSNVDVFCFSEVYHDAADKDQYYREHRDEINFNLLNHLKELLSNHNFIYHPHLSDWWGLAMFIKNDIEIIESGEIFIHKQKDWDIEKEKQGYTAKNLQYAKIKNNDKELYVINIHGLWNGMGKTDTEERIIQSQNILNFINGLNCEYVFCGDFNLLPEGQSLKMLIDGLNAKELVIPTGKETRTSLYKKSVRFADYMFVSNGLAVKEFIVLPDEVSDHNALYLDLE